MSTDILFIKLYSQNDGIEMKLYHMSNSLKLGDELNPDYNNCANIVQPFVQALEQSTDCFYAMVLNGKYLREVLGKFNLREWSDYVKWSVEGAFEYIRKTEFSHRCSRLKCNYFYKDIADCKRLYEYDWGDEPEEDRSAVHLYEVEVADENPQILDMRIFDEAYAAMEKFEDVNFVLKCARKYFAGMQTAEPIWEIMSEAKATAVADITDFLKS